MYLRPGSAGTRLQKEDLHRPQLTEVALLFSPGSGHYHIGLRHEEKATLAIV
jgi:hypothetical protein